jgi:hypothetical protein
VSELDRDRQIAELQAQVAALVGQQNAPSQPADVPPTGERFEGWARCVNQACEAWDTDRPIGLVRETVTRKGYQGEAFAQMVITESTYVHAADDRDMVCPECGMPSALLDKKPVVYPKASVG